MLSEESRDRDIVFVTYSAEEHGLLGARSLAGSGLIEPDDLYAVVNLDMVGRNPERPVETFSNERGPLASLDPVSRARGLDLRITLETGSPPPSDLIVFHRMGAPSISLFTGLHEDYHGLDDEIESIAHAHHARLTTLAYRIVRALARE